MKQIPTWYMGLMILVLAPMVEEFICRALIFKTIKNKKNRFCGGDASLCFTTC